jgi:hypothetical protein
MHELKNCTFDIGIPIVTEASLLDEWEGILTKKMSEFEKKERNSDMTDSKAEY